MAQGVGFQVYPRVAAEERRPVRRKGEHVLRDGRGVKCCKVGQYHACEAPMVTEPWVEGSYELGLIPPRCCRGATSRPARTRGRSDRGFRVEGLGFGD